MTKSSWTLPVRSVTSPTLRSVRRSSELSGLILVNTSKAVIKTEAMSEWRRYLKWRILTLAAGLGIMEACSSNEMGAPNASHLEQETTQPNRLKQTKISPGKRASSERSIAGEKPTSRYQSER